MRFVIITGMSGAGKSQVIRIMEDFGYYCIDNMPPALIPKFAEICKQSGGKIENAALVIDLRSGDLFNELFDSLPLIQATGIDYEILFLDCSDKILIQRYKESRRSHPLSDGGSIISGIKQERELLAEILSLSKYVIDTSVLSISDLKDELITIFSPTQKHHGMAISIISFGYKYGIPLDADLVFDVRFLPNPFYVPELKHKTGMSRDVRDYVLSFSQTEQFLAKLFDMADFLIPHYIEEGKNQLIIAIGCTGGKHRSVTVAEQLNKYLLSKDHRVYIHHRDYKKDR